MAVEVVELKDVDNMAPRIDSFEIGKLNHENDKPYLDITWSATDNCPNSVSVWVDQGYLERRYPDSDNTMTAQINPFEPEDWKDKWTGGKNSFTVAPCGMRWYLDDPAASGTVWIAFQDVCCNEATETTSFEGFEFDLGILIEVEGMGKVIGPEPGRYPYGKEICLTYEATDCWYFVEWQVEDRKGTWTDDSRELCFPLTGDSTVTAIFKQYVYTVYVVDDPTGAASELTADATYLCGATACVDATPTDCYDFLYWNTGDATESGPSYCFTVEGDVTLTAVFKIKQYEVTLSASPTNGGTVTGADTYDCGSEVTVVATPADFYDFVGWFAGETLVSTNTEYTFTVTEDVDLEARFTIESYNVVFIRSHPGVRVGQVVITPNPDIKLDEDRVFGNDLVLSLETTLVLERGNYLLEALNRTGFTLIPNLTFVTWTLEGGVSTTNPWTSGNIDIELTGDATITATFN
ncbi:MAG: hypothetical protein GYA36_15825 [Veillonellaceae bacterium]|nr:hypothetical protein [Veillonellaceae bacterium]